MAGMNPAPRRRVDLLAIVRAEGVLAGLRLLNARVPHRYTGVYRLLDDELRCEHLFDKADAGTPDLLAAVPLRDSFCQYVFRDGLFLIEDSAKDGRLDGHPYQGTVAAYHAVPVLGCHGDLRGTLCHLDTEPRVLPDSEVEYLQKAARNLAAFLLP